MKFIIFYLIISVSIFGQNFKIEKVNGRVEAMRGSSENIESVKQGDIFSGDDLIIAGENSSALITKENKRKFLLQENSALELNYVKEISMNDLLLALAMEEIKDIPKNEYKSGSKNTAVYGSKISDESKNVGIENNLGIMKINGAKQLANSGYQKSAVILAKETFRKYPAEKRNVTARLFFTDILIDLDLFDEAAYEIDRMQGVGLTESEKKEIQIRSEKINNKLLEYDKQ